MDTFIEPDPAERRAFYRLFYRNRRPTWFGHWVSQFFCWWACLGLPPRSWVALEVCDLVSGRLRADAVVVSMVAGRRYIVSMFGTISDWVRTSRPLTARPRSPTAALNACASCSCRRTNGRRSSRSTSASHRAAGHTFRYPSEHRWRSSPRLPRSTLCIESSGLSDGLSRRIAPDHTHCHV